MIQTTKLFFGSSFDPHYNLATEKLLMDLTAPGECTLYLWQNQNTVVIGKNQNAWAECRTSLLEQEGGVLARRLSGGGAVFHDIGNLNFTFLMCREDYDLDKQLLVIQKACELAGISTERSGRNDVLADGRKFSGNAFYHNQTHAYHHGTLMVDVDKDKLGRYLSPPKAKLEAKGIASVRSRVVNLHELNPHLTIDSMKEYMVQAFTEVYGYIPSAIRLTDADQAELKKLKSLYGSWDYLYGPPLAFTFDTEGHYTWGHFQLQLQAKGGVITAAKVYSDAMDWQLPEAIETVLTGCRFETGAMQQALRTLSADQTIICDLQEFIAAQQL